MFLSVDIVGSTAFKQAESVRMERSLNRRPRSDGEMPEPGAQRDWLEPVAAFLSGFGDILESRWNAAIELLPQRLRDSKFDDVEPPKLWKAAGDEVIFYLEVKHKVSAVLAVYALLEAIEEQRGAFHEISKGLLDLKATAWVAGFPVNNAEVVLNLPMKDEDNFTQNYYRRLAIYYRYGDGVLDFIGPQMDLGFRVATQSSQRYMALSADLSCLLIRVLLDSKGDGGQLPSRIADRIKDGFRYLGWRQLKGITGDRPYPITAVTCHNKDGLSSAEDEMTGAKAPDLHHLLKFLDAFFVDRHLPWIQSPFVSNEDDVPDQHDFARRQLLSNARKHFESEIGDGEEKAATPGSLVQRIHEFISELSKGSAWR